MQPRSLRSCHGRSSLQRDRQAQDLRRAGTHHARHGYGHSQRQGRQGLLRPAYAHPHGPLAALVETGAEARYDVIASIVGAAKSGQAGALKHGVARALVEADPSLKTEVKRAGHLSRDARMVERKKAGLKKARKRPQFSKR